MDVHVPEAGEQEFSRGVDGARSLGDFGCCCCADGRDAAGFDENGLVRLRWPTRAIDDGDVRDCELRGWLRRGERSNDEKSKQQGEEYLSRPQRNAHLPGNTAFLESYHKRRWAAEVLVETRLARRRFREALVSVPQSR
jgi:hypothetical protein